MNRSHAHVRSDAGSPVGYSAFDPELQLWVAACLYVGWTDALTRMHGPLGDIEADALYAEAARFGTTLQVRRGAVAPTRRDFAAYWQAGLGVRVVRRRGPRLPGRPAGAAAPPRLAPALTGGQVPRVHQHRLPPAAVCRDLRLPWSPSRQRRFDATMRVLGRCYRVLPLPLRTFPLNACLWRFRRRTRAGRPPW